jgi:signal peptidase I
MRPTFKPGNLLVVDKNAYQAVEPSRGDIVVARYHNEFVVKRIVALPGEEVEVKKGMLYINGSPEPENHKIEPGSLDIGKGKLLAGDFATLGDNRSVPRAQAVHPIVSKKDIVGRVKLSLGL